MFKWFMRVFVQGLVAMVPVALTVLVIVWLAAIVEGMLSYSWRDLVPTAGGVFRTFRVAAAFVLVVFLFGLLMKFWVVRHLFDWVEAWIIKIPLVKTVYGGIKDVMGMFGGKGGAKGDMVVMVTLENGWRQLGIVTRQSFAGLPAELTNGDASLVAVYLPFSYQLGGFTYFIDRRVCEPVPGMSVEDAMRVSIMAWVGSSEGKEPGKKEPGKKEAGKKEPDEKEQS